MIIRNFKNEDISLASNISKLTWGDFYTHESQELQNLIYEFMVAYYDLNRDFSFSAIEDGFKGFLFASYKNDKNNSYNKLQENIKNLHSEKETQTAVELFNYLESCGKEVKSLMNDDDIMLGLFVSIQKGCGKLLLSKLVETCQENNIKNIYLWSDTTCDYDYYQKNNFVNIKEINSIVNKKPITTIIYRKELI